MLLREISLIAYLLWFERLKACSTCLSQSWTQFPQIYLRAGSCVYRVSIFVANVNQKSVVKPQNESAMQWRNFKAVKGLSIMIFLALFAFLNNSLSSVNTIRQN